MNDSREALRAKLNQETGRVSWHELERHYSRGAVVKVAQDLDLVDVAACIAGDETARFSELLESGRVNPATQGDGDDWKRREPMFWGVVVAPWVLVQEIAEAVH
ncbi:MAG: DUF2288 domain-containing protein [Methylotetracoccus sp.]